MSTGWQESRFLQNNVGKLSGEVKDLLDQILVIDPSKRITVQGIMQHPWYQRQLPPHYQGALDKLARQQTELERHVEKQSYDAVSSNACPGVLGCRAVPHSPHLQRLFSTTTSTLIIHCTSLHLRKMPA